MGGKCSASFPIPLMDEYGDIDPVTGLQGWGNPLPFNTALTIKDNAVYSGTALAIITISPDTVPNTNTNAGSTMHWLTISVPPSSCTGAVAGTFSLNMTTPVTNNTTTFMYLVTP